MIDLVVVKALVSENISESYVSLELTDEANLVYDSFMEATQINDGLVVGNVLGDADGTLFDGMEEEQFKFYVLEGETTKIPSSSTTNTPKTSTAISPSQQINTTNTQHKNNGQQKKTSNSNNSKQKQPNKEENKDVLKKKIMMF
uniref:Uncharacterized protein n=1 Tax=Meloidogyne floridensis TaxID=298350 RepID=A0A915NT52_9BILA